MSIYKNRFTENYNAAFTSEPLNEPSNRVKDPQQLKTYD